MDEMDEDERYSTMRESKSYKNTRKFTRKWENYYY
jgi:hypothetical protein